MHILPIVTPLLRPDDNLGEILSGHVRFRNNDILVVSSKALSMVESRTFSLDDIQPSARAKKLSSHCGQHAAFTELVLQETRRMRGIVVGTCPFALLTSLKPIGMKRGRILCPNAGLDQSNVAKGSAIGWPFDPVQSASSLRKVIRRLTDSHIAVIVSDSCCRPGRLGVTAFALAVSGMDPLRSEVGRKDLFNKPLKFTHEAIADQLATAANTVMGNAGQSIPAAVIRGHGFALTNFSEWVEGVTPKDDLFADVLKS